MKIVESTILNASPEAIWNILKNPGNMPAWNPKCQSTTASGDIAVGSTFSVTYRLGKNEKVSAAEVATYKPCEEITIRYSVTTAKAPGRYVDETFVLVPQEPGKTKLTLVVDITHGPLPLWVKVLMWFLSRFGRSAGRSSLDGIRDLLT